MKKQFLIAVCSAFVAASMFGQTQTIALTTSGTANTAGTFNAGSAFNLDAKITFTGYTGNGLSYWLEVPTALAPFISITSEQYFTFMDANNVGVKTFVDNSGSDAGFISAKGASDSGDLGGTALNATFNQPAGTYLVSTLTFTLSGSAPAGIYTLKTTTLVPKRSVVDDSGFVTHPIPSASYTITVAAVPEPSTTVFLLGGISLLAASFVRRRRA